MMELLSRKDAREILRCVHELYGASDLNQFARKLIKSLGRLIPSDLSAYNEVDPANGRMDIVMDADNFDYKAFTQTFLACQHEHPVLRHYQESGNGAAHKISDFVSPAEFHRTRIYNELYKKLGCEDQMAVTLPSAPGVAVAMAFNRSRRSFTQRERFILNLLRPHLEQAYLHAALLSRINGQLCRLSAALETLADGVILIAANARPSWYSRGARALLERFFPDHDGQALPPAVQQWLKEVHSRSDLTQVARHSLSVAREDRRLVFQQVRSQGQHVLLLSEEVAVRSSGPLRQLGLTSREAEVLLWISQGKTNPQIAQILHSRPRTVQKHVEHIFQKLNVQTRAAAGSRATEIFMRSR